MKVGSLFAGIGGFDLAAERAGMTVEWQSEIDQKASAVLNHHWPTIKNLGDIHGINTPPAVDVLTGGFPCQDYSVAGNRGGLAGDRGALWWEYHRLIDRVRPTWVLGENVPGLLSSRSGEDFATIVGSLTELGYGVAWAVLDAQYFGVAQRRRRVFIVGHSGGQPRPEILAIAEGMFGHPAPQRIPGQTVTATLAARTTAGGGLGTDVELDGGLVAMAVSPGQGFRHDPTAQTMIPATNPNQTVVFEDDRRTGPRIHDDVGPTLQAQMGTGGNNTPMVFNPATDDPYGATNPDGPTADDQERHAAYILQGSMIGRNPDAGPNGKGYADATTSPGYTLDIASGTQGVATRSSVRRLTPLECERLQGFPDNWTNIPGNSDTHRYRQLGNAVAVPVVEWILRRIADAPNEARRRKPQPKIG